MPDGGRVVPLIGTSENAVAFEGQHAFVTVIRSPVDVTGASITLPAQLSMRASSCIGSSCAIVAEVLDTTPNSGTSIPSPIDALVSQITIDTADGLVVTTTVNVMPLDRITGVSGSVSTPRGTYFASSLDAPVGSMFDATGTEPVRWLVFGDVSFGGTLDVSADGAMPGAAGLAGGAVGEAATGQGAGEVSEGGGSGSDGVGLEGAAGGPAWSPNCAADFFATECGGGGGGGDASTAGGGGGGAFALVGLGRFSSEGEVVAHGGDGAGGGGGGRVLVSGTIVDSLPTVDVAGGAGTDGADGGDGEASVGEVSLAIDLAGGTGLVSTTGSFVITGVAPADATLRAESIDGDALGTATAGSDGTFSIDVALADGLTRIRLFYTGADGVERRAFVGNHVELERRSSRTSPQPIGGLLDVAYLAGS